MKRLCKTASAVFTEYLMTRRFVLLSFHTEYAKKGSKTHETKGATKILLTKHG